MTSDHSHERHRSASHRRMLAGVIILLLAALCGGALSIPFLYESPSIQYKFGWDKLLLRTGKMAGLAAALLLLLQLPLAGRIKLLDRIFALPGLYKTHRLAGILIGVLVLLHPILVTLPENRVTVPLELRYWPEWVGVALALAVLVQIAFGIWRKVLTGRYQRWLFVHRLVGWSAILMLVIHVLYVSETFEYDGPPRRAALLAAFAAAALWLYLEGRRTWVRKKPFEVTRVEPAGPDTHVIAMKPANGARWSYMPGQFVYVSFASGRLAAEWHPFTLSSSPTRPEQLEISVRTSGDWTGLVGSLAPGDRAFVQGPFGRFSYLVDPPGRELVLIAGGIGITPMLSMLRAMSDQADRRRVKLLWSDKTTRRQFAGRELEGMRPRLPGFTWVPVLTGERATGAVYGRLNRARLERLLTGCSRDAAVFICGPSQMIRQVRRHLLAIGFPAASIREELFGL